jgi:NAD(P)-dependent dehydrogenase (short-subunit alcohol dehydrogenase family)
MIGRVSLVTGTSSGFGWYTALELARRGDRVFAGMQLPETRDRPDAERMQAIVAREGWQLTVLPIDIDLDQSVQSAVATIADQAGRVDVAVNNAGFGVFGPWELTTIDRAKQQLETNFFGAFRVSKAVVPLMRAQGCGWIVNVGSEAALSAVPLEAFYTASKFALEGMTQAMRWELQQFGIRVCTVTPGAFFRSRFDAAVIHAAAPDGALDPYQPFVAQVDGATAEKLRESVSGEEMATRIADILDMEDPPFRNLVGAQEWRVRPRPFEEYEEDLVKYYGLEAFTKPWTRAKGTTLNRRPNR